MGLPLSNHDSNWIRIQNDSESFFDTVDSILEKRKIKASDTMRNLRFCDIVFCTFLRHRNLKFCSLLSPNTTLNLKIRKRFVIA